MKPSRGGATAAGVDDSVPASSREQLIAEVACYRAEQRGFVAGQEMADWLLAKADVERELDTLH